MHTTTPFAVVFSLVSTTLACSRVTYKADNHGRFTVGRSLDYYSDTNTTIWAFPAGASRFGAVQDNPFTWESKYGSVSAVILDVTYTEGINTEGLSGSALFSPGAVFEKKREESRPSIFSGVWLQYFLDTYASVAEAAKSYCPSEGGKQPFQVIPELILTGDQAPVSLSLTDAKGDNLILEFVDGKLQCHHSKKYTVVTDGPSYDDQTFLNSYWKPVSTKSLPGSARGGDRAVRLAQYNRQIPKSTDLETALSYTSGMVRAVSTPMHTVDQDKPGNTNVWPTRWRMYTDIKTSTVYYESATDPVSFSYSIDQLNLKKGGKVKVLKLADIPWSERVGDMTKEFEDVKGNQCIYTSCS